MGSSLNPMGKSTRGANGKHDANQKQLSADTSAIVYNVLSYFKKESMRKAPLIPADEVCERASQAVGLPKRMIVEAVRDREHDDGGIGLRRLANDLTGMCALRRQILFHCANYGKPPSVRVVCDMIQEQWSVTCNRPSAIFLLDKLGFRLHTLPLSGTRLLIEDSKEAAARVEFLRRLRDYRTEGRDVVYLDGRPQDTPPLLVHAGHLAQLMPLKDMFRVEKPDMGLPLLQAEMHVWLLRKLLPFLPKEAVVVVFRVPFYKVLASPEESGKERPRYWLDALLEGAGRAVLRPPAQLADLNPMESFWNTLREQQANGADLRDLALSASLQVALMRTWTQSLADIQEAEDALLEWSLKVDANLETLLLGDKAADTESDDEDSDMESDRNKETAEKPVAVDAEARSEKVPADAKSKEVPTKNEHGGSSTEVPANVTVTVRVDRTSENNVVPRSSDALARLEDLDWIHSHVDPSVWSDVTQLMLEVLDPPSVVQ